MDIEFVDPPVHGGRGATVFTAEMVEKLAANEGQWAKVHHYGSANAASVAASQIRKGRGAAALAPFRWETASRKTENGGGDLYLKCLGPVEP